MAFPASYTPGPIRARIHESALGRVTRFFTSGLNDIFSEALQNSRRAGATSVRISVSDHANIDAPGRNISIHDDGAGIEDPAVLLSFGENGWSQDTIIREDAAGMGFLALARRGCAVRSRPRSANGSAFPGWTVTLSEDHFTGKADAIPAACEQAPWPNGTLITFPSDDPVHLIRDAASRAARYFPLPVFLEGLPDSPPEGEQLDRKAFLDGAVHAERWRGLTFGVFPNRPNGFDNPDVNFHGIVLAAKLPDIATVNDRVWSVRADIEDCPELALVLPARKEIVQTPFLDELRRAARLAIYRAMAATEDPCPTFRDWKRAHNAGIALAPPGPLLRPWKPNIADPDNWQSPPKRSRIDADTLVMSCDPEAPAAQVLFRAVTHAGIAHQLFEADRHLEGFDWYDSLPRVTDIETEALTNGVGTEIPEDGYALQPRTPLRETLDPRPEDILLTLSVQPPAGTARSITMATDIAFASKPYSWIEDVFTIVTRDSTLQPHELAALLHAAYFSPSDDSEADSYTTQSNRFHEEAQRIATELLCGPEEALRQSIIDAAERELAYLVPRDRSITIAISDRKIDLTLHPAPEEAA